uniref:Secreted protein n=1 Tax=Steinernema glaseri TaxID=37863 RepID=A0A1I7ZL37_9BILA
MRAQPSTITAFVAFLLRSTGRGRSLRASSNVSTCHANRGEGETARQSRSIDRHLSFPGDDSQVVQSLVQSATDWRQCRGEDEAQRRPVHFPAERDHRHRLQGEDGGDEREEDEADMR